jgi:hypothetical protein
MTGPEEQSDCCMGSRKNGLEAQEEQANWARGTRQLAQLKQLDWGKKSSGGWVSLSTWGVGREQGLCLGGQGLGQEEQGDWARGSRY